MRAGTQITIVVVAALLVGLLTYGVVAKDTKTTIQTRLSRGESVPAPQRTLPVLGKAGEKQSLADYRGRVVLVNFWASWCEPCIEELPLLQRTQEKLAARNATILGIDVQDAQSGALGFVKKFGLTYPSLRDTNREYGKDLETTGVPESFLVDAKGNIVAKSNGPVDQAWLDENLPKALDG